MDPLIFITIIAVVFIIVAFLTWVFIHRSKEKERLLLIEKDVDMSKLPESTSFSFRFPWLKIGIVITSTTIGMLIGVVIMETIGINEGIVPMIMFLFGGIGMIIAHYVDRD